MKALLCIIAVYFISIYLKRAHKMYTVHVTKECGCFTRSDMKNNTRFDSKEGARKQAEAMMDEIEESFCAKHEFELIENDSGFTIKVTPE